MMWRLNFFASRTRVVMKNVMLYYICPMHTLFTLFVYFALAIGREKREPKWIWIKMAACGVVSACLWKSQALRSARTLTRLYSATSIRRIGG